MENIEIALLVENWVCDIDLLWEWWLSMYIKYKDNRILFDTWATWIFIENSKKMWIDLSKIELIVLSHHHNDHIWGIINTNFADNKYILAHSEVLKKVWNKIKWDYKKIISDNVYNISDEIYFLWEIPRKTSFEKWNYWKDSMLDDTALAIKTDKWVVVITWCSHSGIVNICEYAKKVTWENKIYWVLWGFHLLDSFWWIDDHEKEQLNETINYFKKENPKYLYPFHCVDFNILSELKNIFDIEKLSTWSKIVIK